MNGQTDALRSAVAQIDCEQIIACVKPKKLGVFWRGPGHDDFVFYPVAKWEAVANGLLDAQKCEEVQKMLDNAPRQAKDNRAFVFCWAERGPILGVPMFWASVHTWTFVQPKRRSDRLKASTAKRQRSEVDCKQ